MAGFIYILVGILIYSIIKTIIIRMPDLYKKTTIQRRNKNYCRSLKAISKNNQAILKQQYNFPILEYSKSDSKKYGFGTTEYIRPVKLINNYKDLSGEGLKIRDKKYSHALRSWIPLSFLYDYKKLVNKTLRVYVEEINETVATIRDETAICNLDLGDRYPIAGQFVLININKAGDDKRIKVNYILADA